MQGHSTGIQNYYIDNDINFISFFNQIIYKNNQLINNINYVMSETFFLIWCTRIEISKFCWFLEILLDTGAINVTLFESLWAYHNYLREMHNSPPLIFDPNLCAGAEKHAEKMAEKQQGRSWPIKFLAINKLENFIL